MTHPAATAPSLALLLNGNLPDAHGRFGPFGGRFVPEILMEPVLRLEREARAALADAEFQATLEAEWQTWVGRPTPMTHAVRLGNAWDLDLWLKREDLTHTGAHKINNAVGQALLARRMGARRIVAETGAGQHGVATAAACARIGMPCTVYMGRIDARRQAPNVDRIRRFGAEFVEVRTGDETLRAAIDEAIRAWVADPIDTYYLIGSVVGPHPYPWLVRTLQSVIGRESRAQILERQAGSLPDAVAACVGGGSNAIGLYHAFLADADVELLGFEAGGPANDDDRHAATIAHGTPGVLHGAHSLVLQDQDGQILETHSASAGLDYPGVGPEHAFLRTVGRVRYTPVTDENALRAARDLCRLEGILPALESAHALAGIQRWAGQHPGATVVVGLSGRGDKDLATYQAAGIA